MCGIAGWIDWEVDLRDRRSDLDAMTATLASRGPDARGAWLNEHAAFGHTRLSIVDPDNGAQPMLLQDRGSEYAITFNGEIYNFRELRARLKKLGHAFETSCDTEVLLATYVEWGPSCVEHLNGIFAFAIWDGPNERMFMARDHLGVKPLFYAQRGTALVFGSELKALLAHPAINSEVDIEGLSELFCFGLMHTPGTAIYRDVLELRPGHCLVASRDGICIEQYWTLQSYTHTDDADATAARIDELLLDTVDHQLYADVPVAMMLSGGLDSSLLTAYAAEVLKRTKQPLMTYSIDFVGSEGDFSSHAARPDLDAPWVDVVAKYLGSEHHRVVIDTDDLLANHFVALRAHDLPAMGEIESSLYLLCSAMKQRASVALSGEAADELFGGYTWFYQKQIQRLDSFPFLLGPFPYMPRKLVSFMSADLEQEIKPPDFIRARYAEAQAEVPRLYDENETQTKWREIFYHHLTRFLPMMLSRKDRMSMATGFEVRVPFCDYRLAEYVWNIPWELKNVDDIEKGILRRAGAGRLPREILYRKKSAFPANSSPAYFDTLRNWTLEIIDDPNAPARALFDGERLRKLATAKKSMLPREFEGYVLNFVIQTNAWLKDYRVSLI